MADVPLDTPDASHGPERMWPLDLALAGLGVLAFSMVTQRLSWEDPRPLFNAWTYAIAIPAGILGLDLLLRTVASRFVQRSMQLAFLVSVCVHLGLLMLAVNVVLFVRSWPEPSAAHHPQRAPIRRTIPEHLFHQSSTAAQERPDWERPVEALAPERESMDPPRQVAREQLPTESRPVPADPEVVIRPGPAELVPAQPSADAEPKPADLASQLSRQTSQARLQNETRVRQVPAAPAEASQPAVPQAAETDERRVSPRVSVAPAGLAAEAEPEVAQPRRSAPEMPLPRAEPQETEAPRVATLPARPQEPRRLRAVPPVAGPEVPVPDSPSLGGQPERAPPSPASVARTAPEASRRATSGAAALALPESLPQSAPEQGSGSARRQPLARASGAESPPRIASERPLPGGIQGRVRPLQTPDSLSAAVVPSNPLREQGEVAAGEADAEPSGPPERRIAEARQSGGGTPAPDVVGLDPQTLPIDAPQGVAGLAKTPAPEIGRPRLVDRPDPQAIRQERERFRRQPLGSLVPPAADRIVATDSFRRRLLRTAGGAAPSPTGSVGPETEQAIERGLAYLASHQQADGSWSLQSVEPDVLLRSDTAATGLCLLAFQGAGYTHRQHQYASTVARGIQWLVDNQDASGNLFRPEDPASNQNVWLYSHSIAALALCEAYGMTQDPELSEPAQRSIDFIVASQHPQRGGWRYRPEVSSDTSVTGWMMMALKSGELAGLTVPQATYDGIERWLELAQASRNQPYLFRYNPYAPNTPTQRHGRDVTPTMTAVGLLMRMYGGWRRDHPNLQRGAQYLRQRLPAIGTPEAPSRDTYYWYYATQVMFHMGGRYWQQWNNALHPLLIDSQEREGPETGSWDPRSPVPDRWAPHAGRLYVTAMNLLSLEIFYRHLPIYENAAR